MTSIPATNKRQQIRDRAAIIAEEIMDKLMYLTRYKQVKRGYPTEDEQAFMQSQIKSILVQHFTRDGDDHSA